MALVGIPEVQAWLESTKLRLNNDDDLVEEIHASAIVLGKLSGRFDVSGWVDKDTTPDLVRTIISMLVAAYRYDSLYSETLDDRTQSYGERLEERAMLLLQQLVDGDLTLIDVPDDGPTVTGLLSFYPTDASTLKDDEEDAGRAFSMGQVF